MFLFKNQVTSMIYLLILLSAFFLKNAEYK